MNTEELKRHDFKLILMVIYSISALMQGDKKATLITAEEQSEKWILEHGYEESLVKFAEEQKTIFQNIGIGKQ
jgi:hypothetical protein